MNLAGYVPLRRSVFEHTATGKLSNTKCLVFLLLVALADRRTGSGTINGPTLRAFLPELSHDAAKRTLCSLESKGYVFRDIVPFSKRVYRFWINKYRPTEGKYKALQINILKALESRDLNDIEYVMSAPEGALEGAPDTAPEGALHYKKGEERIEKEKPRYQTYALQCVTQSCAQQRAKRSAHVDRRVRFMLRNIVIHMKRTNPCNTRCNNLCNRSCNMTCNKSCNKRRLTQTIRRSRRRSWPLPKSWG